MVEKKLIQLYRASILFKPQQRACNLLICLGPRLKPLLIFPLHEPATVLPSPQTEITPCMSKAIPTWSSCVFTVGNSGVLQRLGQIWVKLREGNFVLRSGNLSEGHLQDEPRCTSRRPRIALH